MTTPIFEFIQGWIKENGTTGSRLFDQAGLSTALYTQMRKGSSPHQNTLRALAQAMGVKIGWLNLHAGNIEEDDLVVLDRDPEIEKIVSLWEKISPRNKPLVMQLLETSAADGEREAQQVSEDYVDV